MPSEKSEERKKNHHDGDLIAFGNTGDGILRLQSTTASMRNTLCLVCRHCCCYSRPIQLVRVANVRLLRKSTINVSSIIVRRHFWFFNSTKNTEETLQIEQKESLERSINETLAEMGFKLQKVRSELLLKEQKKHYDTVRELNSETGKPYQAYEIPFNLARSVLNLPVLSPRVLGEAESLWINFSNNYDVNYMKGILVEKTKTPNDLRNFWIASIRLSMSGVQLHRDFMYLVGELCESVKQNESLRAKFFCDDFYDCLVGSHFLNTNTHMVKSIHDEIYPVLKPKRLLTIIKSCYLASIKSDFEMSKQLEALFYLQENINQGQGEKKIGNGFHQTLIPYLYSALLIEESLKFTAIKEKYPDNEGPAENVSSDFIDTHKASSSEASREAKYYNFMNAITNSESFFLVMEHHLLLLLKGDIPLSSSDINDLLTYMKSLAANAMFISNKNKTPLEPKYEKLKHVMNRTFDEIFFNERNMLSIYGSQKLLKKKTNEENGWFTPQFIKLMVTYCFIENGYNTTERLEQLIRKIPKEYYVANPVFWNLAYKLCFFSEKKYMIFAQLDKLYARYAIPDNQERHSIQDSIYHNYGFHEALEYKLFSNYHDNRMPEFHAMIDPIVDDFFNKKGYEKLFQDIKSQDKLYGLSPRILGIHLRSIATGGEYLKALDKAGFVVAELDKSYTVRKQLWLESFEPLSMTLLYEFVEQIVNNFIMGVMISISKDTNLLSLEIAKRNEKVITLMGEIVLILDNTTNFPLSKFPVVYYHLISFFLKLRDYSKTREFLDMFFSDIDEAHKHEKETSPFVFENIFKKLLYARHEQLKYKLQHDSDSVKIINEMIHKSLHYINKVPATSRFRPQVWQHLLFSLSKSVPNFGRFEDYIFWVIDMIQHSDFYLNNGVNGKSSLPAAETTKLTNNSNTIGYKLFPENAMKVPWLVFESLPSDSGNCITDGKAAVGGSMFEPQLLMRRFYMDIHGLFNRQMLVSIVKAGARLQPDKPYVGFELVLKLYKMHLINSKVVKNLETHLKRMIISVLKALFLVDNNSLSLDWQAAKRKRKVLEKLDYETDNEGDQLGRKPLTLKECVKKFEEIGGELYDKIV